LGPLSTGGVTFVFTGGVTFVKQPGSEETGHWVQRARVRSQRGLDRLMGGIDQGREQKSSESTDPSWKLFSVKNILSPIYTKIRSYYFPRPNGLFCSLFCSFPVRITLFFTGIGAFSCEVHFYQMCFSHKIQFFWSKFRHFWFGAARVDFRLWRSHASLKGSMWLIKCPSWGPQEPNFAYEKIEKTKKSKNHKNWIHFFEKMFLEFSRNWPFFPETFLKEPNFRFLALWVFEYSELFVKRLPITQRSLFSTQKTPYSRNRFLSKCLCEKGRKHPKWGLFRNCSANSQTGFNVGNLQTTNSDASLTRLNFVH